MSEEGSETSRDKMPIEIITEVQSVESSEDPPMEQWSSLQFEEYMGNPKKEAFKKGLYDPGTGEICGKYVSMSDSSVFRHPYYNYPAVLDPGIEKALLEAPDTKIYPDDGQERYLDLCKETDQCVVNMFYKGLLTPEINLSYYCVNPAGVLAMGRAMKYNKTVKTLNFTQNFLSPDSCYHLGEMLTANFTLYELNLTACRIGPEGIRRLLAGLITNRTLKVLDLSRNALTDVGGIHFAGSIERGLSVKQVNLMYNDLGSKTAEALAEALEFFNNFTHINLSWNKFFTPVGTLRMLSLLQENSNLEELNLSWNSMSGPKFAGAIKIAMLSPNLKVLDLSNNDFTGEAVEILVENFTKAKKMQTFNLSYNPLTTLDANVVMNAMKKIACKVQNLYLENIDVDQTFALTLERMKRMKSKKNVVITYGNVVVPTKAVGKDPREVILDRMHFVTHERKVPVDVGSIILELVKNGKFIMNSKEFQETLHSAGATMMSADLIEAMVDTFKGPKSKMKLVDLRLIADYVKRKWPDCKPPPSPPPEIIPEPQPEVVATKGGSKGKGKKK